MGLIMKMGLSIPSVRFGNLQVRVVLRESSAG